MWREHNKFSWKIWVQLPRPLKRTLAKAGDVKKTF